MQDHLGGILMLSRSVRLYALDLGFTMTDTGAYGNLNGYTTTFKGYDDYHAMFFDVTFPSMESYNSVMAQIEDEEMEKSYKILRHTLDSRTIGIFVRNGSGLIDRFEELSQLVTQLFIQAGGVGNTICAVCKTPFDQELIRCMRPVLNHWPPRWKRKKPRIRWKMSI